MRLTGSLRKRVFGLSAAEATFERRGFQGSNSETQERLEHIGQMFLCGYHLALEDSDPQSLACRLESVEAEFRGFAAEGAAMALTLLDILMPWKTKRRAAFLDGPGAPYIYMIYVGAGWAMARLPVNIQQFQAHFDPLLGWLAIDGFGFHEGYFHWPRSVQAQALPGRLSGYARRVFDQGLGRSLWFVKGADVERIGETVTGFPPARHADLWSGVGLACTYAGGADSASIEALCRAAQGYGPQLAQGAVFAAKTRERAGNPTSHTELACQILCGMPADEAGHLADTALENLPPDGAEPAFEVWRRRIQMQFMLERGRM